MKIMSTCRALAGAALVLGVLAGPQAALAQSNLDVAQAQEFLGSWNVAIQSEMGAFEMQLAIADQGGKVAATVGMAQMGNTSVTDITRAGEALVLTYSMDAQGQQIPVVVNLRPENQILRLNLNFAGGMFSATGTATRANP